MEKEITKERLAVVLGDKPSNYIKSHEEWFLSMFRKPILTYKKEGKQLRLKKIGVSAALKKRRSK